MHSRMGAAIGAFTVILAGCSGLSQPSSTAQTLPQSNARQSAPAAITPLVHDTSPKKPRIYVGNCSSAVEGITTYRRDGREINPTILRYTCVPGVAVDANGKIYAVDNFGDLTTYKPNGKPTTPIVNVGHYPQGVAVDGNGKIYVTMSTGALTTYNADGTPATPTISGFQNPTGVAVDANGKIYVADSVAGTVTTYDSSGMPTTPVISGLSSPTGVAVDANGKIYIAQGMEVATYAADGTPTTPTISYGGFNMCAVTVGSDGKIYVTDCHLYALSFRANGKHIKTFEVTGYPASIAIH